MLYAIGKPNDVIRQYVDSQTEREAMIQCQSGEVYVKATVVAPGSIIGGKIVVTQMSQADIDEEFWIAIRQKRNGILDQYRWTIAEDSPLSESSKAEWLDYYKTLNRITIDYSDPRDVLWPTQPELTYA